jgi:hypothetical protein
LEDYCIALPKLIRISILSLHYTLNAMGYIILIQTIKGVLFMARNIQCTYTTPCRVSQKYIGFYNISFGT